MSSARSPTSRRMRSPRTCGAQLLRSWTRAARFRERAILFSGFSRKGRLIMMATTTTATVSAAVLALLWTCSSLSAQQSSLADRVAAGVQAVERACASDINKFCPNVTRGEGRVLICMQAHDDQLSRICQLSLYLASRNLDRAL